MYVESVDLSTGVALQYVESGDPDGTPVILLHGWTDSWRSFEDVLPYLPASIRAFAITMRGHGGSDCPNGGYTAAEMADDVAAFMDAKGLRSAALVGYSMGAVIATRCALDHPDRVDSTVLLGAKPTFSDPAFSAMYGLVRAADGSIHPAAVRELQARSVSGPLAPRIVDAAVRQSRKVPAHVWQATLDGALDVDFSDELPRVATPTMVVWGARDTIASRADQDALVGSIPDARLVVYAGAGHAVHREAPARFAADVAVFVANAVPLGCAQ